MGGLQLVWVSSKRADKYELVGNTRASVVICDKDFQTDHLSAKGKTFIVVKDAKAEYFRILRKFTNKNVEWGIHPTAVVHPDATVHSESYIGPFSYVGKATIGKGTVLHGHCHIYDNSIIGCNVVLHAHVVVGSDGFGFLWNENNEVEKVIHVGSVVIEDDVEVFAFTNIDRGTLGTTRIGKGSKLDHCIHVSHNSTIGKNSIITAGVVFCGGSSAGDNSWIGVNSIIKEKVAVGSNVVVGLGSVITKNIPNGETWLGSPGRKIQEFLNLQRFFKNVLKDENN